jgi:hypothetical protein
MTSSLMRRGKVTFEKQSKFKMSGILSYYIYFVLNKNPKNRQAAQGADNE